MKLLLLHKLKSDEEIGTKVLEVDCRSVVQSEG